jgi:carbamoylphosphate synthase large subunit
MNKIRKEGIIMNYLLVSPNFPTSQENFAKKLVEKGVKVLGIGSESYDNLSDDLKNTLTEYYRVNDLENYEEVLRGVAFLIYKHGVIDRVESNNEHWLMLDTLIREQFNIPGVKPKNLDFTKYKSKMKERFIKAKVPVAKGQAVKTIKELEKAIKDIKLPVIAKPDNGVGANNTFKLLTKEDVEIFKNQWDQDIVYFIESYVDKGILCTYDGLIDSKGEVVFETSFYYTKPTLDLLNDGLVW